MGAAASATSASIPPRSGEGSMRGKLLCCKRWAHMCLHPPATSMGRQVLQPMASSPTSLRCNTDSQAVRPGHRTASELSGLLAEYEAVWKGKLRAAEPPWPMLRCQQLASAQGFPRSWTDRQHCSQPELHTAIPWVQAAHAGTPALVAALHCRADWALCRGLAAFSHIYS